MQAHAAAPLPEGDRLQPASAPTGPRRLRMLSVRDGVIVCIEDEAIALDGPAARFTLPIDERLRTAVRGGAAEPGEDEMAPALRPREIQSRIRAGASVEQVAAAAGCPVERIEGFAYPVLLERATVAERGRAARPLPDDPRSLEEIVTATLTDRGQADDVSWDAFKDERGWTVVVTWQAGRTDNRAEWSFAPRPTGGTLTARGAEAEGLVHPSPASLRAVQQGGRENITERPVPLVAARHHDEDIADSSSHQVGAPVTRHGSDAENRGEQPEADPAHHPAHEPGHREPAARPAASRRGHKPQMPSWEDVLLGTRTTDR